MADVSIPVPDRARCRMQIRLAGQVYTLVFAWNDRMAAWTLQIRTQDDVLIVGGIKLVLNYPLLGALVDERLPAGELYVIDPAAIRNSEPGRGAWREDDEDLRLVFVERES